MPVYRITKALAFPDPRLANEDGLLGVGGDLSAERLLLAYANGIFPWYDEGSPILWHSPDPRFVLKVGERAVPRSTAKALRRGTFEVRYDERFPDVIQACSETPRPGQRGTWITEEMIRAYDRLFELGVAHSIESYREGTLVGGLYGVSLGGVFFGESMFAREPEASKVAFVTLLECLEAWGIDLVDCQVHTDHLERFGAVHWARDRYLEELGERLTQPTRRGRWIAPTRAG